MVTILSPMYVNAEEANDTTTMYVTADSGLNVRKEGNIESEKIDALPYGSDVKVKYITEDNWACVIFDDHEVYMFAGWLSEEKPKPKVENTTKHNEPSASNAYFGKCKITHYCNCSKCCGKWAGGTTASGSYPVTGRTVAMSGLPFGTKVSINGHVYTVEDRGVSGSAVDIYVDSHSEALSRGMYYADVYIVG